MTPQEIREAVAADPTLTRLVAEGDYAAAVALLPPQSVLGLVDRADFASWAAATGMRSKIEDISLTAGHPLRDSSLAILDVLRGAASGIDLAQEGNMAVITAWVQTGQLPQGAADALISLGTTAVPITWQEVKAAIEGGV